MTEPDFVAKTLAWCNARRATQGKKPLKRIPKGRRRDPNSCPCGHATGLYVEMDHYIGTNGSAHRRLPKHVRRFVHAFDSGTLPQYETKR